jgi:hypothetical protein
VLGTKDTTVRLCDGLGCPSDRGRRHRKITSAIQAVTVGDGECSGAKKMVIDRLGVTRNAVRKCIKRGSIEWKVKR